MNFGLDNIRNSCYINSTLQIIAEMTDIIEILRKYKDNDENLKNFFNILDWQQPEDLKKPNELEELLKIFKKT
jgi:ubiquitin C-terminal hydrolase